MYLHFISFFLASLTPKNLPRIFRFCRRLVRAPGWIGEQLFSRDKSGAAEQERKGKAEVNISSRLSCVVLCWC